MFDMFKYNFLIAPSRGAFLTVAERVFDHFE